MPLQPKPNSRRFHLTYANGTESFIIMDPFTAFVCGQRILGRSASGYVDAGIPVSMELDDRRGSVLWN